MIVRRLALAIARLPELARNCVDFGEFTIRVRCLPGDT